MTLSLKGSLVSRAVTFVGCGDEDSPSEGLQFDITFSEPASGVLHCVSEGVDSGRQWVTLLTICSEPDYEETSQVNHLALPGRPDFKGKD